MPDIGNKYIGKQLMFHKLYYKLEMNERIDCLKNSTKWRR